MAGLFSRRRIRRKVPIQRRLIGRWVGTKANSDVTLALTGEAVSASAGTLTPAATYTAALSGSAVTVSAGTVAPDTSVALAGAAVTASAGTLTPETAVALSGSEATASAGTLTPDTGTVVDLTGSAVTASAGALSVSTSASLAGSAVTASAGTLTATADYTAALAGSAVTSSAGTLTPALTVALAGQSVTVSAGTLTPDVQGDVTLALTGESVTVSAGTLTATGGEASGTRGAGRARRRRRYVVEIDGQLFDVDSAEEATALLQQAATLASKAAETAAQAVVRARLPQARSLGKVKPVEIAPRIKTDAPETPELVRAKTAIQRIYEEAAQRAEMQLLLERQAAAEDEQDIEDLIAIGAL